MTRTVTAIILLFFAIGTKAQQFDKENDNRVGMKAVNFTFENGNMKGDLYSLIDSYQSNVLVFFYSPDCEDCQKTRKKLAESKSINRLLESGQLQVLAVAPEVDMQAWEEYQKEMPDKWINSYCVDCTPITKSYIWTVPTLFLIGRDKTVLKRDFKHRERNKYN